MNCSNISLYDDQSHGDKERHNVPTFLIEAIMEGGMGALCLRQPAVNSLQY